MPVNEIKRQFQEGLEDRKRIRVVTEKIREESVRIYQRQQKTLENEMLMVLTGGLSIPEPTNWPPKHKTLGIIRTKNVT